MEDSTSLDPKLRTVSDTFLQQLERLLELEELKRETPVDDEGFPALARAVEDGVKALLERAEQQRVLADEAHIEAVAEGVEETIDDVDPALTPSGVLQLWRDAERRLASAPAGSSEARQLAARSDRLRAAYQRAYLRDLEG
jgi:hypothetical protein